LLHASIYTFSSQPYYGSASAGCEVVPATALPNETFTTWCKWISEGLAKLRRSPEGVEATVSFAPRGRFWTNDGAPRKLRSDLLPVCRFTMPYESISLPQASFLYPPPCLSSTVRNLRKAGAVVRPPTQ